MFRGVNKVAVPVDDQAAVRDELPHSNVFFVCDDTERTHQERTARGVRFHKASVKMPFGWWAMFEDAGGSRHALTQKP